MTSTRAVRIVASRLCTNLLRGEVNCILATCFLVLVFVLLSLGISIKRTPTIMTSLENAKLNMKELESESENTILIEHENGNVYIAFKMKDSAKIVKDLKSGVFNLKLSRNSTSGLKAMKLKKEIDSLQNVNDTILNKTLSRHKNFAQKTSYPLTILDHPYNINNKFICKGLTDLSFIVIVHSATTHFMRRSSIRETWANYNLFKKHSMRIVFLLGKPQKDSTQILIEHEANLNKDIIQGTFMDSYRNLTHKGVLGLRWVSEVCQQAKVIVKVDDDVFLNVFTLMKEIESNFGNKSRHIWCPVRKKGTSLIQRDKGKWVVDASEFKNMTHFPVTYCNGFVTILTQDIVKEMYDAAKVTPFFWVDDVYLFGLLPDKIGNVTHFQLPNLNLNENDAIKCFESKDKPCHLLVANAHSDGIMDKFWFSALQHYRSLAEKYSKDGLFVQ